MNRFALALLIAVLVPNATPSVRGPVPASGVIYTPPFTGGKPRPQSKKNADVVSVKDFGAVGDGVTDDTAAINAAFDYVRLGLWAPGTGIVYEGVCVVFPRGRYKVTSINATGIRDYAWCIRGEGAVIFGTGAGNVVLDLTWSRTGTVRGINVYGDTAAPPKVGIQIGRKSPSASADGMVFDDVILDGSFTLAAFANFASENSVFNRVIATNRSAAASTWAWVQDGINHTGITSAYQTIAWTPDAASSFNQNVFIQCSFIRDSASGQPALWMSRTAGHRYVGSYIATYNAEGIDIYNDAFGQVDLDMDIHVETSSVTSCIKMLNATAPVLKRFRFRDMAPQCTNEIINLSALTSIVFRSSEIDIPTFGVVPANGMFDSPSKANFQGRLNYGAGTPQTLAANAGGWIQSDTTGGGSFVGSAFRATSTGDQSFFDFEGQSGASGKKRGRITYDDGTNLTTPGWIFQNVDDSSGFVANNVTITRGTAGNGAIGINVLNPTVPLDVSGAAKVSGNLTIGTLLQANLGTPANGTIVYCSDCNAASACTAGGSGALASRQNGAWKCL